MDDAEGAAQVSKAMPVKVVPPVRAGATAAGETCWGVGFCGVGMGAAVVGVFEGTAEARTGLMVEGSGPQVACSCVPVAANWIWVSWLAVSVATRAVRAPTLVWLVACWACWAG